MTRDELVRALSAIEQTLDEADGKLAERFCTGSFQRNPGSHIGESHHRGERT
jgi:hypothetical protein